MNYAERGEIPERNKLKIKIFINIKNVKESDSIGLLQITSNGNTPLDKYLMIAIFFSVLKNPTLPHYY